MGFCRQRERYTVSGRCLNRSRFFCNVGNFLRGGRRNQDCSYRECAECLTSEDCTFYDQYCSGNTCITRSQPTSVPVQPSYCVHCKNSYTAFGNSVPDQPSYCIHCKNSYTAF